MNTPFENDNPDAALVERIRGFTHDDASPAEQVQLCNMLKQLAEKTVDRYLVVVNLENELRTKLSMADIREKMSEVLVVTEEGNHQRRFIDEHERLHRGAYIGGEWYNEVELFGGFWSRLWATITNRKHWVWPR